MLHGDRGISEKILNDPMFNEDHSPAALHISKKIAQAKGSLILDSPFFGYLLSYLPIIPVEDEVSEFATDSKYIYFNTQHMSDIILHYKNWRGKIKGMMIHLILHLIFRHHLRQKDRVPKIWAYAADIVVYSYLLEFKHDEHIPTDWELINFRNIPEELLGHTTEKTYDLLLNYLEMQDEDEIIERARGADVGDTDKDKVFENISEDALDKLENDLGLEGNLCDMDQVINKSGQDGTDVEGALEEDYLQGIIQLSQEKSRQGFIPSALQRILNDLFSPIVNWKTQLTYFLQNTLIVDTTWNRPNKRLFGQGYYLPGVLKENADILVGLDTSGSISNEALQWFLVELQSIIASISNAKLTVVDCDAKVQQIVTYDLGEAIHQHIPIGGGGTDFRPVFSLYEQYTPEIIIYFTDGLGIYPEKHPSCPVIWVIVTEGEQNIPTPPFGKVLTVNNKDLG